MAIERQIWMAAIVEGLFASNSFLSKAFNADEYVIGGKTVHIPNAGSPSNVEKNRVTKPAQVKKRTDVPLSYDLDEYTTDPIYISNAETVELSYSKRESVIRQDKRNLLDQVSLDFIFKWSPTAANTILTTGDAVAAHTPSATGNRKAFTKDDVLAAMVKFNADDVPQEGRFILVDAVMHAQLLNSLTAQENAAFLASADAQNGVVGQLYSFNVMMRSRSALYTTAKAPKAWSTAPAATDLAGALAWHEQSVCRALGEVNAFENEGDPTYYGDIYSFLVRAGGRIMRSDNKGVLAIIQDTVA